MSGTVNTSNISLSHLKTAYNNVNNPTHIGPDISISKFRGCELVVGGATGNETFSYTGSVQTYTILAGVTSIHVQCWGADGGSGGYYSYSGALAYSPGGLGAYVEGDVAVSTGQTVYIYVGGRGYNWHPNGTTGNNGVVNAGQPGYSKYAYGGWGGGVGFGQGGRATKYGMAGGGAASHIRLDSTSLGYRQIIAGGGGGGGNSQSSTIRSGGGAGGGSPNSGGHGETMNTSTQFYSRAAGVGGASTAGTNSAGSWSSNMDGNAHYNKYSHNNLQGGGGGGYYGGGQRDNSTGSGGGSSYIGGGAVTNGLMYMGTSTPSEHTNPSNANPLTGDIDNLKHGYIKISYGSQTLSNVPASGPISIDSDFKGKTFINMAPSMEITAGIANNHETPNASTTITFTSTEPTSDFDASSITINMGTLSIPQFTDSLVNGGYKIFTSTLTFDQTSPPNPHTIDVLAGAYTNSKTSIGCQNTASALYTITYQTGFDQTWNLKVSTIPSGLIRTDSDPSPYSDWHINHGFRTAGNATGFAYPLSTSASFTGDHLFQASVWYYNSCSDPSICLWDAQYSRTRMQWSWSTVNSYGISFQCNCTSYPMINTPGGGVNGVNMSAAIGEWVTMHLWHRPSTNQTSATITIGPDDWDISGTKIGYTSVTSKSYSISAAVYMGLGSDYDGAALGTNSTNFSGIRVRDSNMWVDPTTA